MPRSGAFMDIRCDTCGESRVVVDLTKLRLGGWSEAGVDEELERRGWRVTPRGDICPLCAKTINDVDDRFLK
jgi:hypothetical protein